MADKITKEKLEEIANKLHVLPEPEKKKKDLSKIEAIRLLSKEIASLQKKGYTFEQIAVYLTEYGLKISTPTLKNYIAKIKGTKKIATIATNSKKTKQQKAAKSHPEETPIKKGTFTARDDSEEI